MADSWNILANTLCDTNNIISVLDIGGEITIMLRYVVAILKMTATADAGTFVGAPISEHFHNTSKYMYTKFGAFIKK